jgi:hypothetical protein
MATKDTVIDGNVVQPASMEGILGADQAGVLPTSPSDSTELTVRGSGGYLASLLTEDISPDDVQFPLLRMAQGLTPEVADGNAKIGQFVMTGYDAMDEVVLIPLGMKKRQFCGSPDDRKKPLCWSDDGVHCQGDSVGMTCTPGPNQNPRAQWHDHTPPQCDLIYSYICWSVTHQSVCALEFKRTSTGTAKAINTMAMNNGGQFGNFAFRLFSTKQQNKKGTFAVASVAPAKNQPQDSDWAKAAELSAQVLQ